MSLKNTHDLPPEGFWCFIPETGYMTRKYTGLEDTVTEVQRHREANSRHGWPTDKASIRAWVLASVEGRLRAMPRNAGMQWLVADSPPPPPGFSFPPRQRQPGRAVVERSAAAVVEPKPVEQIKNTLAGIGLWIEWFGDAPVAPDLAAHRATICARCPLNQREGNPIQRFNEAAAKEIFAIFSSLKHANLSTLHDDMLGVCGACDCPMKAKVWSPLKIINKHLRPEAREKLHVDCWIRSETAADSD